VQVCVHVQSQLAAISMCAVCDFNRYAVQAPEVLKLLLLAMPHPQALDVRDIWGRCQSSTDHVQALTAPLAAMTGLRALNLSGNALRPAYYLGAPLADLYAPLVALTGLRVIDLS
jgi:hypothetical protein